MIKIDDIITARKFLTKHNFDMDTPIKPLKVAELMAKYLYYGVKGNELLHGVSVSYWESVDNPPIFSGDYDCLFANGDMYITNYDNELDSWHNGTDNCAPTQWRNSR